jgi:hypothetical protein
MLQITVPESPKREFFNEATNKFYYTQATKEQKLQLEHSLISLSKWESKWHKPFLSKKEKKTDEQIRDYVRCMSLTQNVDPNIFNNLSSENITEITDYINDPMTATWFRKDKTEAPSRETVTSELIYYWMISLNIPFECQKWHLNRLLTLIQVCNIKNAPSKKVNKSEILARNHALNAERRAKMHSHG